MYLTNIASHVTLVHRRDKLRAEKILQDHLFEKLPAGQGASLEPRRRGGPRRRAGRDRRARRAVAGGTTRDLDVTGLFIAIGHTPNTELFQGQLDMKDGYIVVKSGIAGDATRPACQAYSRPATWPTTSIARRSRRPAPAAWRRSMRTDISSGSTPRTSAEVSCASPIRSPAFRRSSGMRCEAAAAIRSASRVPAGARAHRLRRSRHRLDATHLLLHTAGGELEAALPLYLKSDSWGEFVFDWSWARAYAQAGLRYYPKLVSMPPLHAGDGPAPAREDARCARALAAALIGTRALSACPRARPVRYRHGSRCARLGRLPVAQDCQFHWRNRGYASFEAFLAAFPSEKRKKARASAAACRRRHRVPTLAGEEIDAGDAGTSCPPSRRHVCRRGHEPYLNAGFFRASPRRCLARSS